MAYVGQPILIHYSNGQSERSPRRVAKVFKNGRIQVSGKICNWYEEAPGLYRMWNNPGCSPMVAALEDK